MKAVVLGEFGDEGKLLFTKNHPRPRFESHEVLIKVRACGVSALDVMVRRGVFRKLAAPPLVPGYEISGVVEEVGAAVEHVKPGDEVVALAPIDNPHGGCAEFTVQDALNVVKKPEIVSHEDAAACLLSGVTAMTAVHYQAHVTGDDFVLYCGSKYAADAITLQILRDVGAKVIATAASTEQLNALTDAGAHIARVIDLSSDDVVEAVMKETGGMGVNVVLDFQQPFVESGDPFHADIAQGGEESGAAAQDEQADAAGVEHKKESAEAATKEAATPLVAKVTLIQCLGPHGRLVTMTPNLQLDPPDAVQLFLRGCTLSFLFPQVWVLAPAQQGRFVHVVREVLERLARGRIKAAYKNKPLPLDRIRQAHRDVESEGFGRVVVKP